MDVDMDWVLKQEDVGYIEVNGLVAQRVAMVYDKVLHQRPNMREHGLVDFRMDTVRKPMLMEVR